MTTQQGGELPTSPNGDQPNSMQNSEKFVCQYARHEWVLVGPPQYSLLLQDLECMLDCRPLLMECAIGEIWVALTCQEDLDIFIELEKCNRSSRLGFNIRVFPKPAEISSPEGVKCEVGDQGVPGVSSEIGPPGVPGTSSHFLSSSLQVAADNTRMGHFRRFSDNTVYQSARNSAPVLPDSSEGGHEVQAANCKTNIKLFSSFKTKTESLVSVMTKAAMAAKAAIRDKGGYDLPTVDIKDCGNVSTPVNWTKVRMLGRGTFGQVFLCRDRDTGRDLAVKEVSVFCLLDEGSKEIVALRTEIQTLEKLTHPRIVQYYGSQSYENGSLAIFMEYMPGGSIQDQIKTNGPLNETLSRRYTKQVLEGLSYLHQKNIIHRDIKGANILRDGSDNIKLCDFGTSKQLQTVTQIKSFCGTFHYMSPELVTGSGYGCKTDIWSLGCTVVEMLSGKPPWHKLEGASVIYYIGKTNKPTYELPDDVSSASKAFIECCFKHDPSSRPSADDLLRDDPFICDASTLRDNVRL